MADHQKEQEKKPLLYKVEPREGEQITTQREPKVKHEQIEEVEQTQTLSNKEEQIEQLKRKFGVYEALAEVEREKAIALEWTREFQKKEKVEQQPRQEQPIQEQEQRKQRKRKQQTVQVQYESPQQEVVPKKRKKKKSESVTEIITRLTNSRSLFHM